MGGRLLDIILWHGSCAYLLTILRRLEAIGRECISGTGALLHKFLTWIPTFSCKCSLTGCPIEMDTILPFDYVVHAAEH